jgi:hypothetical protein
MASRSHQLRCISLGDEPDAWSAIGFDVTGRVRANGPAYVRLGNTTVVLTGSGGGFTGWAIDGITDSIDAMTTLDPRDAEPFRPGEPHPNGITAIDHVVVNTGDVGRTAAGLTGAGLQCRGGRSTTSYGSPMRQQFYWLGDVILELVGPDEGEPTSSEPAGLFGLALVSDDLDETVAGLGDLAGIPKDAVQPGRRIAGIRGGRVGVSLPLAVMSPHSS